MKIFSNLFAEISIIKKRVRGRITTFSMSVGSIHTVNNPWLDYILNSKEGRPVHQSVSDLVWYDLLTIIQ